MKDVLPIMLAVEGVHVGSCIKLVWGNVITNASPK